LHVFQRQTRESSVAVTEDAAPLEPFEAVVAEVDGAGVLPFEFEELDDWAPVSWGAGLADILVDEVDFPVAI